MRRLLFTHQTGHIRPARTVKHQADGAGGLFLALPWCHLVAGLRDKLLLITVEVDPETLRDQHDHSLVHRELGAELRDCRYLGNMVQRVLAFPGGDPLNGRSGHCQPKDNSLHLPRSQQVDLLAIFAERVAVYNHVIAFWLLAAIIFFGAFFAAQQV